jgi:hypothetical protein
MIDYFLKSKLSGPATLEVLDAEGKLVRRYSSADKAPQIDPKPLDIVASWVRAPRPLSAEPGMHRFVWDLRYPGAPGGNPRFRMFGMGTGPWAPPGQYTVKLTVNGQSYSQPLTVKIDPRVKTPLADLMKQFEMARQIGAAQAQVSAAFREAGRLHEQLQALKSQLKLITGDHKTLAGEVEALDQRTIALAGGTSSPGPFEEAQPAAPGAASLRSLMSALSAVERAVESADVAPTADVITAFQHHQQTMQKALVQWNELKALDLRRLNASLRQLNLHPISVEQDR